MPLTVAQIAARAMNRAGAAITDAVHVATLGYVTRGAYDHATGGYAETPVSLSGRAVVATETPIADAFPDYVAGPGDELVLLEGFTATPKEGWELTFSGRTRVVRRVQDIAGAGTLFYAVAR